MNSLDKAEKEVLQARIKAEKQILKELEEQYKEALEEINDHIAKLLGSQNANLPHVIHRVEYQRLLKQQVQAALDKLHSREYESVTAYLNDCYTDAFVGTVYTLHHQDMPVILPVDQNMAVKAITLDTKLKETMYEEMGKDISQLKKTIRAEITRGISSGMMYSEIANNLSNAAGIPMRRAKTIARTEAGRVQEQASHDAALKAMSRGADLVKQWSAVRDGKTRDAHRMLHKQTREMNEYFEINGKKAMHPHDFGDPALDCNCRCTTLHVARASLDEDTLKRMQEDAHAHGLLVKDSKALGHAQAKNIGEFKTRYLQAAKQESDVTFWDMKGGTPNVDYSVALTNRFEEGTDVAKAIYTKYIPQGSAVADGQFTSGIAHFENGKVYMDYASDAVNPRGAGTTFFHEHGHFVDAKAGYVSHSEKYLNALKADMKAMYASTGERAKPDAEYAIAKMLYSEEYKNKAHGISDIVYGLSKGRTGGKWYHKEKGYYKDYALQQEAFAHMFEASFSTEKQMLMKRFFPTAWELFNEIMEGIR